MHAQDYLSIENDHQGVFLQGLAYCTLKDNKHHWHRFASIILDLYFCFLLLRESVALFITASSAVYGDQ
jgi:hypothetical protein